MSSALHSNMTALVTGATGGIGFHTAATLSRMGMHVMVTGRDEARGREAVSKLKRQGGHSEVVLLVADGSSVLENLRLADEIVRRVGRLDVLVNNVGGAFAERRETAEEFETTLAINFIGPFALTSRLLPLLSRSVSARVVNVVSSAFQMWKHDPLYDLQAQNHYVGIEAYAGRLDQSD